jgi:hypothetical protein
MRNKLLALLAGTCLLSAALLPPAIAGPAPGTNSPFNAVWNIPVDSIKYTYSASFQVVNVASATDIAEICGGAGVTTRISRISVGGRATAAITADVVLASRSAANAGGTSTAGTAVPYNSGSPAAKSTVLIYTANPSTVGTLIGNIAFVQVPLGNLTTTASTTLGLDFATRPASEPALIGAAQCIGVNLNATTYSGGLFDITIEWTEE